MELKVEMINTTPLLQIENSDTVDGVPKVFQKKKECIENGKIGKYPYYSANGWRGLLHREIANLVLEKSLEKGIKLDTTNVHILQAGGGSNFQDQPLEIELKIRELNPIASVFGVSLAVEGKLMISDFEPTDKKFVDEKNREGLQYSQLTRTMSYIKKDDIATATKYGRILSDEDIKQYQEDVQDVQDARKDARESESTDKIKKLGIQAYNSREYIIPGTKLTGYIGSKMELTDIEKGMLLKGITLVMSKQIGSTQNLGFGVMEYIVSRETENHNENIITASKNSNNIFKPIVELSLSKEDQKCIAAFEEWLENIEEDNILLSKTLLEKKK